MLDLVGQTLGQYQLLEIIHEGDNDVYKAFQSGTNRYIAVKVLVASLAGGVQRDFNRYRRQRFVGYQ